MVDELGRIQKGEHLSKNTEFKKGFAFWKGKKFSDEHLKNMSISRKGKTSNRKGCKLSEETKRKLTESHKGKIPWNKGIKTSISPWNKGIKLPYTVWNKGLKTDVPSWNKGRCGELATGWKGGICHQQGYVYLFQPFHPNADKKGYVKRANLVMEGLINRFLTKEEIVHHINHNREDDCPENLKLFVNKSEHQIFHTTIGRVKT